MDAGRITIDGTTIQNVGIRLKGNSTLQSLTDERDGSNTQGQSSPDGIGGMKLPEDGELPEDMELPEGFEPPEEFAGREGLGDAEGEGGGMGTGIALSTDEPENLPLLVSFDKYDSGRAYQGMTELSVRPASQSYASALNEAVALELTASSGQATQQYSYTSYTVNDRPTTTRLVIENPDAEYASGLDGEGVLYKLRSTSSFTYQGEDQTSYEDDFAQVNAVGSYDLQPIISFLEWLDEADAEEFAAELDQWIDIESFATYLGTQDVLDNFDTISGPGRNAYLYYDVDSRLISVVSWDLNLAFGGMAMGGGFPGGMDTGEQAEGQSRGQMSGGTTPGGTAPENGAAPEDGAMPSMPEGGEFPGNGQGGGLGGGQMGEAGFGMMADNPLVTRFEEDAEFATLIEAAADELRSEWIDGGQAAKVVDTIASRVPVTEGVDAATIESEKQSLLTQLTSDTAS